MGSWTFTRRTALGALAAGAAAASPLAAFAQGWPSKPIKIVVGYSAGGAVDIVTRTLGQALSTGLGQSVIVENKPGAGTTIAAAEAARDGFKMVRGPASCWPAPLPCRWCAGWRWNADGDIFFPFLRRSRALARARVVRRAPRRGDARTRRVGSYVSSGLAWGRQRGEGKSVGRQWTVAARKKAGTGEHTARGVSP